MQQILTSKHGLCQLLKGIVMMNLIVWIVDTIGLVIERVVTMVATLNKDHKVLNGGNCSIVAVVKSTYNSFSSFVFEEGGCRRQGWWKGECRKEVVERITNVVMYLIQCRKQ